MPPRQGQQAAPEPEAAPEDPGPPYYVATENLPYTGPGAMPVLAFAAGDHVPPDMVEPNRWGDRVEVPEQFRGKLAPPPQPTEPGGEEAKES